MKGILAFALGAMVVTASASDSEAQERRPRRSAPRVFSYSISDDDQNRAVIGVTTSTGSPRDTLGVLVSSVQAGGPAERAGIEEGNRIAAVNGVNLRLSPADVGDWEMSSVMSRRLTRELSKANPGDEVDLRVYGGGQTRTLKVKTVSYDSLYTRERSTSMDADEHAALGVNIGSSGSRRDTLGVFVMSVDEEGPAAKAGIVEGYRIAAINNVDLRVSREDAGDPMVGSIKAHRLQRELNKLKPGDEVELRVYGEGRTRTVRVKTVAMSSLSSHKSMIIGGHGGPMIPGFEPMAPMGHPMERLEELRERLEHLAPLRSIQRLRVSRVTL